MKYYVEVEPNVKLFVRDINTMGDKTIVFVHGWPVNNDMYEYQYNVLPNYGWRCVGIDLRGYGKSDKPWFGYNYERLADDIRKVIEQLNLNKIVLMGFSMGGPVVIKYMSKYHNDRVKKLVLLSAAAPSFTQYPGYPYGKTIQEVNEMILLGYKDRPQLISNFGNIFFHNKPTPAFLNWFNSLGFAASGYGTINGLVMLRDERLNNDLKNINVPTGIFYGIHDQVCDPNFALILHQNIPNSEIFKFNNSGHAVFYDELELFNQTLLMYISKN